MAEEEKIDQQEAKEVGPEKESLLEKPITRGEFLKVIAAGGGVLLGKKVLDLLGGPEGVKKGVEAVGAVGEGIKELELYKELMQGEPAVELERIDYSSGILLWRHYLDTTLPYEAVISPTGYARLISTGPTDTELYKDVNVKFAPSEVSLFYDSKSKIGPRVRIEVDNRELQIARYELNFTVPGEGQKTVSAVEYLNEKGEYLGQVFSSKSGDPALIFAIAKKMAESGYDSVDIGMKTIINENGDLLGIRFMQDSPIIRANKVNGAGWSNFYQANLSGTGARYIFDRIMGRVEPYPPIIRNK